MSALREMLLALLMMAVGVVVVVVKRLMLSVGKVRSREKERSDMMTIGKQKFDPIQKYNTGMDDAIVIYR